MRYKLTENKLKQIITETIKGYLYEAEEPVDSANEQQDWDVIYTANNVIDPAELERRYPSGLPNKYYHHSTNKFGKQPFDEREGTEETLRITGRLTTDKVDVLVVDNPNSTNAIAHITLATADGVKPVESNTELQKYYDEIIPLNDKVETVFTNNIRRRKKRNNN